MVCLKVDYTKPLKILVDRGTDIKIKRRKTEKPLWTTLKRKELKDIEELLINSLSK